MKNKKNETQKVNKVMTGKQLLKKVIKRLTPLDELSLLERYAMFMGKAQLIEIALKHLLVNKYNYKFENLERTTLGGIISKLKKEKVRQDFIFILDELLDYRNDLAHNFLLDNVIGKSLIGVDFERLSQKQLRYALYKVEEVTQVYDFLIINGHL